MADQRRRHFGPKALSPSGSAKSIREIDKGLAGFVPRSKSTHADQFVGGFYPYAAFAELSFSLAYQVFPYPRLRGPQALLSVVSDLKPVNALVLHEFEEAFSFRLGPRA